MKNFKEIIKRLAGLSAVLIVLYMAALMWWRLWMYKSFIGPIPILHWFVETNGESSYTLTEYEMFIHLVIGVALMYFFAKHLTKPSNGASR
jgi:hypothetical protein